MKHLFWAVPLSFFLALILRMEVQITTLQHELEGMNVRVEFLEGVVNNGGF